MSNIIAEQPMSGSKESFSWLTDIIESQDGSECRIGIRSYPRINSEYSIAIHANNRNTYHNLIRSNFTDNWLIPNWFLAKYYGSIHYNCDTLNNVLDQKVGDKFLIYQDAQHSEINNWVKQKKKVLTFKFISSVPKDNIFQFDEGDDFNEVVNINFTKNNYRAAYIIPLISGVLLNAKYSTSGYDAQIDLQFDITNNITEYNSSAVITYKNMEVVHNNEGKNESLIKKDITTIDYETGKITRLDKWTRAKNSRSVSFYMNGYDEINDFKRFIYRVAGRLNPFWFCDNDVAIHRFTVSGNTILIPNNSYINLQTFKYVALFSGEDISYAEVLSVNSAKNHTTLTLDKKPVDTVWKISNLMLCRFDTDTVQIS
ncbi:MAG: hypothetical protein J6562_08425, partial [Candidatus Schmidhempelia sp.]|nr:hypothetical protein [Candidatus Schmidhempelia sp.]